MIFLLLDGYYPSMMSPASRGLGCDNLRNNRHSPYPSPYQRPDLMTGKNIALFSICERKYNFYHSLQWEISWKVFHTPNLITFSVFFLGCPTYYRESSPPFMNPCVQNNTWPLHHLSYASVMTTAQMKPNDIVQQTATVSSFAPSSLGQFPPAPKQPPVDPNQNPWNHSLVYSSNI